MATININRGAGTVLSPLIDDSSKRYKTLNGQDYIVLSFRHDSFVEFYPGDHITWNGQTYTIQQVPQFKKVSEVHYEYELRFEGPYYDLDRAQFRLDGEGEFFLTGTAEDFVDLIVTNLNRVFGGGAYSTGSVPSTDFKNLQFRTESCLNVLQRICKEFELEYYFSGSIAINLSASIGVSTGLSYQYADGLRNIKRSKFSSKDLITRLFAYGSEKNIVSGYGNKRLHLPALSYPDGYMEQNVATFGIRESTKFWDEIYPHFTGTVDSSPSNDVIIDASIDFDLNSYHIEGTSAKIIFKTGDLAGMEFEISEYNHSTHQVTFIVYTDEQGNAYPSATFSPAAGDEFTFVDIEMPAAYITAAESALETAAAAYLDDMSSPNVEYEVEVDWHHLQTNTTTLDVGDLVEIVDTELAPGGINYRILQLEQSVANQYKYTIKTGEFVLVSYISQMNTSIQELTRTVQEVRRDTVQDIRRGYLATDQLRDDIFDPDGYFDTGNIRPLSIETSMITVGFKSSQLTLAGVLAEPNYNGNENYLEISTGQLIHFTIDSSPKTWNISSYSSTSLSSGSSYYMYVRCEKSTSTATWIVTTSQYQVDPGGSYYYFLVGHLSTPFDNVRRISWLYGQTTINGAFIKTGRISSIGGGTYFDLESGVIAGAITFLAGSSGYANISDAPTSLADINSSEAQDLADALADSTQALADAAQALSDAAAAQATADGKIVSYWQTSAPAGASLGDIWFDTDDGNRAYRWNGSSWQDAQDDDIAAAIAAAQTAQTTADGKAVVYYQASAPTGADQGDLWVETDQDGRVWVYTGATWQLVTVSDALQALSDAADALAAADGKITSFWQDTPPVSGMDEGDIWFDTNDGNRVYVYASGSWEDAQDSDIASAIALAQTAQTTADGKAVVYYQTSAPTGASAGDLWIDTDDSNKAYIYSGSSWVAFSVIDAINALANAATAQSTADGKVAAFWQDTAPVSGMSVGDVWFDTDDGNKIYEYRAKEYNLYGTNVIRQSAQPGSGMYGGDYWIDSDNNNTYCYGGQYVDDGNLVFVQSTAPVSGYSNGDWWLDSNDDYKVYQADPTLNWNEYTGEYYIQPAPPSTIRREGTIWFDSDASYNALKQNYAWQLFSGDTFFQDTAPTSGMSTGDFWIDTDGANAVYEYSGSAWVAYSGTYTIQTETPDPGATNGDMWFDVINQVSYKFNAGWYSFPSASRYIQSSQPSVCYTGYLWFESDQSYRVWMGTGEGWILRQDNDIAQVISDLSTLDAKADGKVTTFWAPSTQQPTATGIGDLWYQTDIGKLVRWDGSSWGNDVADVTQTIIDGGLVTTGRLEVKNSTTTQGGIQGTTGAGTSEIGLWLGATYANRATAPFRVTHGGAVTMTNASIATGSSSYIGISSNTLTGYYGTSLRFRMEVNGARGDAGELYLADTSGNDITLNPLGLMRGNTADYVFRWDAGYLFIYDSTNISGTLGVVNGGQTLNLAAGASSDHVFMAFYADSSAQTTRSGWFGFGSAGSPHMNVYNEMTGGHLYMRSGPSGYTYLLSDSTILYRGTQSDHIWNISGVEELRLSSSELRPYTHNGLGLGDSTHYWYNAYIRRLFLSSPQSVPQSYKLVWNDSTGEVTYEADASDIHLKKNVRKIENALDKVKAMNGYTFKFNRKGKDVTGQDPRILRSGLIAQEVEKVFPAPVRKIGGTDYLSLKYEDMTGLLVEAIKELNIKVDQL